jgi:secreted trypsin-like serine protease
MFLVAGVGANFAESPVMRKVLVLTSLVLAVAGCNANDDLLERTGFNGTAITNGSPHDGHPSVGMFRLLGNDNRQSTCTGTLIGRRHVLTAAHCTENIAQAAFDIGGTQIAVTQLIPHPNWDPKKIINDVAIARLAKDAPASVSPTPVSPDRPTVGTQLALIGYGLTDDGKGDSGVKRIAHNSIKTIETTRFSMEGSGGSLGNICMGDSGGPSFATHNGQEVQVGVHSFGRGYQGDICGHTGFDARLDIYIDWLETTTQGDITRPIPPDTTAPTVTISNPKDGATLSEGSLDVTVQANDDTELASIELQLDGNTVATITDKTSHTFQVTPGIGPHNLRAIARDVAGNQGETTISITVQKQAPVDQQPPRVTIVSPQANAQVPAVVTVKADISDDTGVSTATLLIDGTPMNLKRAAPFSFEIQLSDGNHVIEVEAEDSAGNRSKAAVDVTVSSGTIPNPNPDGAGGTLVGGCSVTQGGSSASTSGLWMLFCLGVLLFSRKKSGKRRG